MSRLALLGGAPVIAGQGPEPYQLVRELPLAERFAAHVGASFALPVSSGTAALVSALIGAGVEPGDEVITVAHGWFSTVTSILSVGAVPIFVDVDPLTFTIDPSEIEARLGPRCKAILGVSLYGHPIDYAPLLAIARRHELALIDDACQATGASQDGVQLGALADLTAFSFSGVKPLASTGGGMVTTQRRELYERAMLAGQHPATISELARDPRVRALASTGGYGHNFRMDARCAERAYEQLERLELLTTRRRAAVAQLDAALGELPGIRVPFERPGARHVYHMYTLIIDEAQLGLARDDLLAAVVAEGVPAIAYTSGQSFVRDEDGLPCDVGPVHARALLRQLADTRRCGPHVLPADARIDSWRLGALPISEDLTRTEINIQQRSFDPPFDRPETPTRFAEAFAKVIEHADELRAAKRRGPLPRGQLALRPCDRSV